MAEFARPSLSLGGARLAGRLAGQLSWWLGRRGSDAIRWPATLVRAWPERAGRLSQTWQARPVGKKASPVGARGVSFTRHVEPPAVPWAWVLGTRLFDLAGGPELAEMVLRSVTRATPLTSREQVAAMTVLGSTGVRWSEVCVAEGGLLACVFRRNGNRAFATWHTVNLPQTGPHTRARLDIVIHELVHVYQYERAGSVYIVEALVAQRTSGYSYGGAAGLNAARLAGHLYRHYNREQQAQIAQDYFLLAKRATGTPVAERDEGAAQALAAYTQCIAELRGRGDLR